MALTLPFPVSGHAELVSCPYTQKISGAGQQNQSASRDETKENTGPEQDSGSDRNAGRGAGGGSGTRAFEASGFTETPIPTLPATQDIAMAQPEPEPEREAQPEIGNIGWSTPDDEIWQWIVTGELELPRTIQCGTRSVDTWSAVNRANDSTTQGSAFNAYVRPGSSLDTAANRQTFHRDQQHIQDALVEYARNPDAGGCEVVEAYDNYTGFLRSLQIAEEGIRRSQASQPSGLTAEQQTQWDQFMREFNGIMEGVTDPSTVSGQLEDWYSRFRHSEAYLALNPPSEQVPGVGSRPGAGGRLTYGFTLSGLAPSFEGAQASADQADARLSSHGFTTQQSTQRIR